MGNLESEGRAQVHKTYDGITRYLEKFDWFGSLCNVDSVDDKY